MFPAGASSGEVFGAGTFYLKQWFPSSTAGIVLFPAGVLWPGGMSTPPLPVPNTWTPSSATCITFTPFGAIDSPRVYRLSSSAAITILPAAVMYPGDGPTVPPPEPQTWQPTSSAAIVITPVGSIDSPRVYQLASSATITIGPSATPWALE